MRGLEAARAYQSATRHRSLRDQEADVFQRVNTILRSAQNKDAVVRSRALANNDRLWMTLLDQIRDPGNELPVGLRASIISVGLAVRRETSLEAADFEFLIGINQQMAAGLSGLDRR